MEKGELGVIINDAPLGIMLADFTYHVYIKWSFKMIKILPLIILLFISCTTKIIIPETLKQPVKSSELENAKINEGIQLHDQGFYKKAIKLYEEALQLNPDNVLAIYEISYSYFQLSNPKNSLKYSLQGLEYKSDLLSKFYMMAGNNLDILGKSKQAVEIYKKAIKLEPDQHLFYYNLGIAYFTMEEFDLAENNFIESIKRNQNHSSSHIALAKIYMKKGEQIPSLLLLSKFLILEPKTQRSVNALKYLEDVMASGVTKEDGKNININLFSLANKNNSRFSTIEIFFKLSRANRYIEENIDKSELQLRIQELGSLFAIMKKDNLKKSDKFLEKYLITYFSDLREADFSECFTYYIHQLVDNKEIQDWLRLNWPKIQEFEKWNSEYRLNI